MMNIIMDTDYLSLSHFVVLVCQLFFVHIQVFKVINELFT